MSKDTAPSSLPDCGRIVVLSPHLDDAVLSCGGLLATRQSRGRTSTVVTVFDGDPEPPLSDAARRLHQRCGLGADAMETKRAEDDRALAVLGCDTVRCSFPEALYRRDERGHARHSEIDSSTPAQEQELVDEVSARLGETAAVRAADCVLAPLSIGNHIDHRIVASAARLLRPRPAVWWYEDIPYLLTHRGIGWRERLRPEGPSTIRVDDAAWSKKLAAISCYRSQHAILWSRPDRWQDDFTSKVIAAHGSLAERLWQRSRPKLPPV